MPRGPSVLQPRLDPADEAEHSEEPDQPEQGHPHGPEESDESLPPVREDDLPPGHDAPYRQSSYDSPLMPSCHAAGGSPAPSDASMRRASE